MTKIQKISLVSIFLILTNVCKIISSFNIEELKHLNYEVDILQTPIKEDEQTLPAILMKSKYGQEYKCVLPLVEKEDISKKEALANEKDIDIKDLLKPMQTGACLLKVQDWWTYEICLGLFIKQFHIEEGHIMGQVLTLGLYESDYDWTNETNQDKFKHIKQPYHSQWYVNGTKCDLTGKPRNTEIRMVCEPESGDYVYRVDEHETCSYIVTIHTSRVCSYPPLKPATVKKAHIIPCHPVLSEEQYNSYMQKVKEEQDLEDQKRSQWLKSQEERLQVMKMEVLQQNQNGKTNQNSVDAEEIISLVNQETVSEEKVPSPERLVDDAKESDETFIVKEYNREIEKLKSFLSPNKFATARSRLHKHFDKLLKEAENDPNPELSREDKVASLQTLTYTLNVLLNKLDQAENDAVTATEELSKAKEMLTKYESHEHSDVSKMKKDDTEDSFVEKGTLKESADTSVPGEDELHVRIAKLNHGSTDDDKKLYEINSIQRKKLEQAVKEKLEKVGWDTGDRKIEVKIITSNYGIEDDNKFETLSEDETIQFQNMIVAMLTGQQESVKEKERQKKLEENYRFNWKKEEKDD